MNTYVKVSFRLCSFKFGGQKNCIINNVLKGTNLHYLNDGYVPKRFFWNSDKISLTNFRPEKLKNTQGK